MTVSADGKLHAERDWWVRAVGVLQAPRPVFAALRDDSDAAAEARQEPILAIVLLAAVSLVLGTTAAGRLFDDAEFDPLLVAVWAFLGGVMYAAAAYFGVGALLYWAARLAGERRGYRLARHVLAYAAVPLVLSLVVWPVRIAVYGEDLFRTGGDDRGPGNAVFEAIETGFLVWAVALVALGVRTVYRMSWPRALAVTAAPAAVPALALARAYGVL
jgi:hypothetical protein